MGAKHGKYVYLRLSDELYAKLRLFKKRDPSTREAYLFTNVFVKKPPRKAKILSQSDVPEDLIREIREKLTLPPSL